MNKIDAVLIGNNEKVYFLQNTEYTRYDKVNFQKDTNYPKPIKGHWPGVWESDIDSAVNWSNGKAYLFKGSEYIRYDLKADKADQGYPKPIAGNWPGLWDSGINAAVNWGNGKAYFFRGEEFISYDIASDHTDSGYPRKFDDGWPPSETKSAVNGAITLEQLSYIMKGAKSSVVELHLPFVNNCMNMFDINTPLRIQHFLSQCGHESGSLKYMHEIASGAEYEGRKDLGNIYPGDGEKFRGRGPIQLTGRSNYTAFFGYLGRPELIDSPEILEEDYSLAWQASGWFWTIYAKINKWADADNAEKVTRKVNGGLNGYADRLQYLKRAKEVIK